MRVPLFRLILLTLLLLFSQQQLAAHELSHYGQGKHERQEQASFQHACEKCVSLAPFTGAVASTLPPVLLAQGDHALASTPAVAPATPEPFARRNRGPPPVP